MKAKALDGIRVLEYATEVSGPYLGKLLADLGAEVIKIEPPGRGDGARQRPPFPGDEPHPEKSGLFAYLNTNKLGVTLDPEKLEGREIFMRLAREADVLIEDRPVGEMERLGLSYETLKADNPGLIMISITPFGRSGPYKDYKARQLNLAHASGQGYLLPIVALDPDRPPVKMGGNSCDGDAGLVAGVAVLAAVFWKGVTGQGQFIELSKQEALMSMQRVESVTYANDKVVVTRHGDRQRRSPGGMLPCKDGHVVVVTPEEHQFRSLMALIGDPDWSKEDWCQNAATRNERADEVNQHLIDWMKDHTKDEIFRKGQALSCPIAPANSAEDVVGSEHLKAREFFVPMDHPEIGRLEKFPSSPYRFSETPWRLEKPAPRLGQHNPDVFQDRLGLSDQELERLASQGII